VAFSRGLKLGVASRRPDSARASCKYRISTVGVRVSRTGPYLETLTSNFLLLVPSAFIVIAESFHFSCLFINMATLPTPADILTWPAANYINPETRRPLTLGIEIPLTILTVLFTAGRFYSRTVIVKALGWDDWFMLAATVRVLF
jgi:hypothetical protein